MGGLRPSKNPYINTVNRGATEPHHNLRKRLINLQQLEKAII